MTSSALARFARRSRRTQLPGRGQAEKSARPVEVCDSAIGYIEDNRDDWIEQVGSWCPWGAEMVDVQDNRSRLTARWDEGRRNGNRSSAVGLGRKRSCEMLYMCVQQCESYPWPLGCALSCLHVHGTDCEQ